MNGREPRGFGSADGVFFAKVQYRPPPLRNHSNAREYPEPHVISTRVAHNHNTMLTDFIRALVVVVVVVVSSRSHHCCRLLNEATPFSDSSDPLVLSNRKVYLSTLTHSYYKHRTMATPISLTFRLIILTCYRLWAPHTHNKTPFTLFRTCP